MAEAAADDVYFPCGSLAIRERLRIYLFGLAEAAGGEGGERGEEERGEDEKRRGEERREEERGERRRGRGEKRGGGEREGGREREGGASRERGEPLSLGTSQAVDLALAPALAVELALAPALAGGHAGHAQAPRGAAPTITAVIAAQVGGREVRRRCRGPKEARGKNSAAEGARAAIAGWRGERAGRGVVAPSDGLLPRAATVGRRPGGQKPGDDGALDGA